MMKIKILEKKDIIKVYKKLFDFSSDHEYILKLYSIYKYYLDKYLNKLLHLEELNYQIEKNGLGIENLNNYKPLSYLDLNYIFLINNIEIHKLSKKQIEELEDLVASENDEKLLSFVVKTFKSLLDNNGTLIIGVTVLKEKRFEEFFNEKIKTFMEILNIPVIIKNLNEKELKHNKLYGKYLPIGSVIILNQGVKKIMITGHGQIDLEKRDNLYDYVGCFYPEGIIESNYNIAFNHNNIETILALGYVDEQAEDHLAKLKDYLENKENIKAITEEIK